MSAKFQIGRCNRSGDIVMSDGMSKKPVETLEMLSKVYGESTMARSKFYEWPRRFKEGRESIEDDEHVG
ncbi:hypothetical protein TNCV_3333011 [Trichonephila clavipes]|nr:hypothetical protein TNCV_3333011 [Trichonephila clavipes]